MTAGRDTVRRPTDPLIEQVIDGRYRIVQQLGQGGMGLVYEAKHDVLGSRLALKILRSEVWGDDEALARLKREAQTASAIGHENIVDVRDFGQLADGSTYVVMELIDGSDLLATIRSEGPLSWERARHVALQICAALGAAHEAGVVHRDLKPENVLLTFKKDTADFVKIVDFGIALVEGGQKITRAGHVVGTPEYMSPEQCAGIQIDHRADIYALGVLLFEMVTGELPFKDADIIQLVRMHMQDPPPPIADFDVEVPEGFEAIVQRCLAKRPAKRFASMSEVAAALRAIEEAPIEAPDAEDLREAEPMLRESRPQARVAAETVVTPPEEPTPSRSRMPLLALALVAAVGGAILGVSLMGGAGDDAPETTDVTPEAPAGEGERTGPEEPVEQPSEAPVERAQMTIDSVPPGAEVYEGSAFVGNTPYAMLQPEGDERVTLTLRADGYEDETVAVSALSAAQLRVNLSPREARVRPDPPPSDPTPETTDTPSSGRSRRGQHQQFLDPWSR